MYKEVVALYGVPRSGTSWLGEIINSCPDTAYRFQPLFSYRFKSRITTESSVEDMEQFFRELYDEDADDFLNCTEKREQGMYPVFHNKKLHPSILVFKEVRYLYTIPLLLKRYEKIKIAGIVRNPYDVLESWMNAPAEYKPGWDIFREWNFAVSKNEYRPENYYGYYKWKEWMKLNADMKEQYPDRFITVRYEDLEDDAYHTVEKLFGYLHMPFTNQTAEFIQASQSRTVDSIKSVYRKRRGAERRRQYHLPEEIRVRIPQDLKDFPEAGLFGYAAEVSLIKHKAEESTR